MDMVWNGYSWNYVEPNYITHEDNECELIIYCFRTPAYVHMDGIDYPVEYGDMLLMPKGKAHKIDSNMGYLTLDWLEIRMNGADNELLQHLDIPTGVILHMRDITLIINLYLSLSVIASGRNDYSAVAVTHLINAIIYTVAATVYRDEAHTFQTENPMKLKYPEIVNLHHLIYTHPEYEWSLEMICEMVNYSAVTISRVYKQIYYVSCREDIIHSRISKAKYLLTNTTKSIKAVAEECGFHSYEHFNRTFRREVGSTPKDYRSL